MKKTGGAFQRAPVVLKSFNNANYHKHMSSKGGRRGYKVRDSPLTYKQFSPPYQRSFLPARISTLKHHLKRPTAKFYVHKEEKVENKVAKLARALGADVDSTKSVDLSPSCFMGYVPTKKSWTPERFKTYFSQDPQQSLLYGGDYGLESLGHSWLCVDKSGKVATRSVQDQHVNDKVTFRLVNFDNLLAYQPLVYGKPVWVVVVCGLGGHGSKGWHGGSFLAAKVQKNVALPISEQVVDDDIKFVHRVGDEPHANANVRNNNMQSKSIKSDSISPTENKVSIPMRWLLFFVFCAGRAISSKELT